MACRETISGNDVKFRWLVYCNNLWSVPEMTLDGKWLPVMCPLTFSFEFVSLLCGDKWCLLHSSGNDWVMTALLLPTNLCLSRDKGIWSNFSRQQFTFSSSTMLTLAFQYCSELDTQMKLYVSLVQFLIVVPACNLFDFHCCFVGFMGTLPSRHAHHKRTHHPSEFS